MGTLRIQRYPGRPNRFRPPPHLLRLQNQIPTTPLSQYHRTRLAVDVAVMPLPRRSRPYREVTKNVSTTRAKQYSTKEAKDGHAARDECWSLMSL